MPDLALATGFPGKGIEETRLAAGFLSMFVIPHGGRSATAEAAPTVARCRGGVIGLDRVCEASGADV